MPCNITSAMIKICNNMEVIAIMIAIRIHSLIK